MSGFDVFVAGQPHYGEEKAQAVWAQLSDAEKLRY